MAAKRIEKFVHAGQYAAVVEIDWVESDTGWPPCLSLEDAEKLDDLREALRRGDLKRASQLGGFTNSPPSAMTLPVSPDSRTPA